MEVGEITEADLECNGADRPASVIRISQQLGQRYLEKARPTGAEVSTLSGDHQAILAVIDEMQRAWNRGDFHGYMAGFSNPAVVFVSRGRIQRDWQATLDHYIADYGGTEGAQGQLTFSNIRVEILCPDAAQLISNYTLDRPAGSQSGINTRLMRKRDGKWLIALNHVSQME